MFAYPVGPHKDVRLLTSVYYEHGTNIVFQLLFLDRELAETLDPRDDRTSAVRSRLLNILLQRMRGTEEQTARNGKSLDVHHLLYHLLGVSAPIRRHHNNRN